MHIRLRFITFHDALFGWQHHHYSALLVSREHFSHKKPPALLKKFNPYRILFLIIIGPSSLTSLQFPCVLRVAMHIVAYCSLHGTLKIPEVATGEIARTECSVHPACSICASHRKCYSFGIIINWSLDEAMASYSVRSTRSTCRIGPRSRSDHPLRNGFEQLRCDRRQRMALALALLQMLRGKQGDPIIECLRMGVVFFTSG